jgi:predicted O-linked N-acetylglucosamine transferase (SPINDLY family)
MIGRIGIYVSFEGQKKNIKKCFEKWKKIIKLGPLEKVRFRQRWQI